jgi:hypothetical protein
MADDEHRLVLVAGKPATIAWSSANRRSPLISVNSVNSGSRSRAPTAGSVARHEHALPRREPGVDVRRIDSIRRYSPRFDC